MGRLRTIGWETSAVSPSLEGSALNLSVVSTALPRSGSKSLLCSGSSSRAQVQLKTAEIPAINTAVTVRCYYYFSSLPTVAGDVAIMQLANNTSISNVAFVTINSSGQVGISDKNSAAVGVRGGSLTTNQWYRIELSVTPDTITTGLAELRVDGVTISSVSGQNFGTATVDTINCGWCSNPGWTANLPNTNPPLYLDDFALNSASGATQNSFPGEGKVVLLKPVSDNAVGTGWLDGDGVGTLFGSVDNTPPVGVATAADGTQIKNLTSTTTGNYDANLTTYAAAGLLPTDTVTLVQGVWDTATKAAALRAGAIRIVSNPTQAAEESINFGNGLAQGTWATNWLAVWGTAQVGPSIVLTTAPVLRIGKRVASTAEVSVDFMGLYVEYVQGLPIAALHPFMDGPNTNTLLRM